MTDDSEARFCTTTHVKRRADGRMASYRKQAEFAVIDSNSDALDVCESCLARVVRLVNRWDGARGMNAVGHVRVVVLIDKGED